MGHSWVYIATPSGADLWRTIDLAKGNGWCDKQHRESGVGVLRRSKPKDEEYRQRVREIQPGDVLLLTYDLFHTGLVYPLGEFRVTEPRCEERPRVAPVDGFPALGRVADTDSGRLRPDYESDEGLEYILLGQFEPVAGEDALKIYERADTNNDHALHRSVTGSPLKEIKPKRARELLDALVPQSEAAAEALRAASNLIPNIRPLDGRGKQLLVESCLAEKVIGCAPRSYALAAFPLCLLGEYELQRLLARVARRRLQDGRGLRVGSSVDELSWVPEPRVYETGFGNCIHLFCGLEYRELEKLGIADEGTALRKALYQIAAFRNRLAHSFFLEKSHYDDVKRLVAQQLAIIYADR